MNNGTTTQERGPIAPARTENDTNTDDAPSPGLSPEELGYLAEYEAKLQMVRDRVGAVVRGYDNGFYLHGPGGGGKSHAVTGELRRLRANFKVHNSRMTGRGLYNALEAFPDAVHLLEDMEQIMRDRGAQGVLRSALWGQRRDGDRGPQERQVTWSTHKMEHRCIFTGGIIIIANRPMLDCPEWFAIKTRIPCMLLQPTEHEMRALMRRVALEGHEHGGRALDPGDRLEVCEFVIEESLSLHRPLDIRLLLNAFGDYLSWEEGDTGCHWRDLVAARVRDRPTHFREAVSRESRAERTAKEREIAREIAAATADRKERLRLWRERTGKSEPALYRRLAAI